MRSLTLRLALLSALWVALGLAFTGWFVAGIAEGQMEAAADARIADLLDGVVAAAAIDANGIPRLERFRGGSAFERPLSGQYWRVIGPGGTASSRSLWDATLPPPARPGTDGPRARDVSGPRGARLRLLEQAIELPGAPGPLTVQVAVARDGTDAEIHRLQNGLTLAFVLLGLGLVAGVAAQVVLGLAPLRAARRALAEVRAGTRDRLAVAAPTEIAPLVEEVDALIAGNRETLERARAHVGNLAHALKTPVAVALNALDRPDPRPEVALAQTRALEGIVQHHLARARSSALSGAAGGQASPLAVAEEVAVALRRLQADRGLEIVVAGNAAARVRVDRQDLIEIVGNLMENACKWAVGRVRVEVSAAGREIALTVEDDGPGLPEEGGAEALARGVRLDEAAPGSGLGLAIVADLAGLHGGRLGLGRSLRLGGARIRLELPAGAAQPGGQSGGQSGGRGRQDG